MSTKDFSSVQEKRIAEYLGWEVVPGSGAADCYPGDIISENWLGECKTHTDITKVIFRKTWWDKICTESVSKHRRPAIFSDDGSQNVDNTWVVFPETQVSSVSDSFVRVVPSIRSTVNVTFDNADMKSQLRCAEDKYDNFIAFSVKIGNQWVALTSLEKFLDLLENYNA